VDYPPELRPGDLVHIKVDFRSDFDADYRSCVQTLGLDTGSTGEVACGDWYHTPAGSIRRFDITHPMWKERIRDHIWIEGLSPVGVPEVVAETYVEIAPIVAPPPLPKIPWEWAAIAAVGVLGAIGLVLAVRRR